MPDFSAAQLHQAAREERARRQSAWAAAGQTFSDRALQDDALWSNIEQMAGRFAGDPVAMKRWPWYWTPIEREAMIDSTLKTAIKAEMRLDPSKPDDRAKIDALWHLFRWLRNPGAYRRPPSAERQAA
jgi:hypothetical protein